jgi:hypothetical protein
MRHRCTLRIKWNGGDPASEESATVSTDELADLLKRVRERFAEQLADEFAAFDRSPYQLAPLGGFGAEITNHLGQTVEVAAGKDAWFLCRIVPSPAIIYSDNPPIDGPRSFYLDGGHHTEFMSSELASEAACLRVLFEWLESGEFPG